MRAVHEGEDALGAGAGANRLDGEGGGGGGGEMAEEDHFRPGGDALPEVFHPFVGGGLGEGDGLAFVHRARFAAVKIPDVFARAVFVVGGEDFVTGGEGEGPGDDVDAEGGVGNEDEVVGVGVDVCAHRAPRGGQVGVQFADDEADGLAFEFTLPVLVGVKDRARGRAKRAVVEENDFGVE